MRPGETSRPVDVARTVNSAVVRLARQDKVQEDFSLELQDIHLQLRSQSPRRLVVFTVDTSDSMGDGPTGRMSAALGAIVSLAATAYLNRDQVCLITFRDREATLVVPPTNSVTRIRQQLGRLPIGGATPLTAGLKKARQVIDQEKMKNPALMPLMVLITDGEATVSLKRGADPEIEVLEAARQFRRDGIPAIVIDTLSVHGSHDKMSQLADALGGKSHHIHNLKANEVLQLISDSATES